MEGESGEIAGRGDDGQWPWGRMALAEGERERWPGT